MHKINCINFNSLSDVNSIRIRGNQSTFVTRNSSTGKLNKIVDLSNRSFFNCHFNHHLSTNPSLHLYLLPQKKNVCESLWQSNLCLKLHKWAQKLRVLKILFHIWSRAIVLWLADFNISNNFIYGGNSLGIDCNHSTCLQTLMFYWRIYGQEKSIWWPFSSLNQSCDCIIYFVL